MSKLSTIKTVDDIARERAYLVNRTRAQEQQLLHRAEGIRSGWQQTFSRLSLLRSLLSMLLPKIQFMSLLWPLFRRVFRRLLRK